MSLCAVQVQLLKQEKVCAVQDCEATLAMSDAFTVDTKPHGHGDVHVVLHRHGLAEAWAAQGMAGQGV